MRRRGVAAALVAAALLTQPACAAPSGGIPPDGPSTSTVPASAEGPCRRLSQNQVAYPVGDAQRVTIATAKAYGQTNVSLTGCVKVAGGYAQEWHASGYAGTAGFGRPGDVQVDSQLTPSGSFTVTEAFGREDPGTKLDYHRIVPSSRWGGRAGPDYNRYFEGAGAGPDENMWQLMQDGLYKQGAVINYNRPPDMEPRPGLTYAIFLHAGMAESWGCLSTDLATVTRFLQDAVPGDRIVMGVDADVFRLPHGGP